MLVAQVKYSKTCLKRPLKKNTKMFYKTDYHLMQVKSIAECSKRAFCNTSTFIKLPFVFDAFPLSIFEWPLKTGFAIYPYLWCGVNLVIPFDVFGLVIHLHISLYVKELLQIETTWPKRRSCLFTRKERHL